MPVRTSAGFTPATNTPSGASPARRARAGIGHERFSYRYQGLDLKLTGQEQANVVQAILA